MYINRGSRFPTPVLTVQVQRVKLSAWTLSLSVLGSPSDIGASLLDGRTDCKHALRF